MKPLPLLVFALLLSVSAIRITHAKPNPAPGETDTADELQLVINTDPVQVFQKAFWRHPQADDKIRNAERREWVDTTGTIVKWQWFIVLEPSPQTQAWLDKNPFTLVSAQTPLSPSDSAPAPEWFPTTFEDHQLQQSPTGALQLARSPDGDLLYATDAGHGFQ